MLLRLLFPVLALLAVSAAESFDKPTSKIVVHLGPSASRSGRRAKVTCYFYSRFMVKEVDRGEKGADRLSIVPITPSTVHRCAASQTKAEMVINADEWSGYFKGVKKDLVFFDGDDLVNGGMGFAVYDAKTGKRIFEDSALGDLEFSAANGPEMSVKYTRVVDGQCIVPKDQAACWEQIRKTIGVDASPPDCKQAYEQSAQKLAKGRCQAQNSDTPQCVAKEIQLARDQTKDATSIIAYPVEVTLGSEPSIKPMIGDVKCWPSD